MKFKKSLFLNPVAGKICIIVLILAIFTWVLIPSGVQQSIVKSVGKIDSLNLVSISNRSKSNKVISFSINNRHFFSQYSDIVKRVIPKSTTGEDSIKRIWNFTSVYSYHFYPLTVYEWLDDPLVFFNSAGFGFCHDVSKVNEVLWKTIGYDARSLDLKEHVVSEVYQENKWKLLDSDIGCYYLNDSFQIASSEEIYNSPQIVLERRKQIDGRVSEMNYKEGEWKNLCRIFSVRSNILAAMPLDPSFKKNVEFELPPNSTLDIGEKKEGLITDIIEGENHLVPVYSNIVLNVPYVSRWKVNLPLILQDIKGEGTIVLNGQSYQIGDPALITCLRKRTKYINFIYINEARNLSICLLFNKKIFELSENNILKVYGTDLKGIEIRSLKKSNELNLTSGVQTSGNHVHHF